MEVTKYYTPTIDEIYDSPELIKVEDNSIFRPFTFKLGWFKNVATEIVDIRNIIDLSEVKIKYLDKEDIESLGFEYKETINKERDAGGNLVDQKRSCYIKDIGEYSILLNHFLDTHYIMIRQIPEDEYNYSSVKFIGTIKNKSELVRILRQVGIND